MGVGGSLATSLAFVGVEETNTSGLIGPSKISTHCVVDVGTCPVAWAAAANEDLVGGGDAGCLCDNDEEHLRWRDKGVGERKVERRISIEPDSSSDERQSSLRMVVRM